MNTVLPRGSESVSPSQKSPVKQEMWHHDYQWASKREV